MNFFMKNRIPVITNRTLFNVIMLYEKPNSFSKYMIQHIAMKSPLPAQRVNRTVLLLQQMFSKANLLTDFLWCSPDDKAAYIWYQCEVRSSKMSPQKIIAYCGQSAPRNASITASEARSQTISRTAPKLLHWLNFLAAMPSKASRIPASEHKTMVATGCQRQVKMARIINKYRRQPIMFGMKRNTF